MSFENPLLGILGAGLAGTFAVLLYLSYKRTRVAEKRLELVRWRRLRGFVNVTNVATKIGVVTSISFLLAVPYFPTTIQVPVDQLSQEQLNQSGTTLMLLLDISYSMNNTDIQPSRLQAAKQMATLLVGSLGAKDMIGFLSFAGQITNETLPTSDHTIVMTMINNQTLQPSTAIGTALSAALGVLEPYQGGRAIVLLSDGANNYGIVNMTSVTQAAAVVNIPIFTIFTGTYGIGDADPVALEELSSVTGGRFYEVRSTDTKTLVAEISKISKEVKTGALKSAYDTLTFDSRDYYAPLAILAASLVACLFMMWFTGV